LKLDYRTGDKVYQGVRQVSGNSIDTCDDSEPVENVNDSVRDDGGVRVSGQNQEMIDDNLKSENMDNNPVTDKPFSFFDGTGECCI
jgi:hypothetical protein